jgi:ribosomal protein L11 methyltransferase
MQYRDEVCRLLTEIGSENIWRPVLDGQGNLLASGHEDMRDGAPEDLTGIDFQGKSVLDLGCNLGFYSFLAKRAGAATVHGLDIDSQAIELSTLLQKMYGLTDMRFSCLDFTGFVSEQPFDLVLLINFIGKRSLVKGIQPILDVCQRCAGSSIILSARSRYHIRRSLKVEPAYMGKKYGKKYIRDSWFDTFLFLQDYLGATPLQLSPDFKDTTLKRTLLFTKSS